jgi:5-methylcytosine-specific restriction protein B
LQHYHERHQTGFAVDGLINVLKRLNTAIDDPHYAVGVTFFLHEDLGDQLEDIWRMEIEPYLEEHFFDQPDQVDAFRWAEIASKVLA